MKKIGIYTFWNVPNYGTFLQAYALQKKIQLLSNNIEVKQIGYLNQKHYANYYSVVDFSVKYWCINPHFYKKTLKNVINIRKIYNRRKFLDYYNMIPHIKIKNEKELINICLDNIVLGSDIIWDFSIDIFGKDEFLFGNKFKNTKIISYASSFGTIKKDNKIPNYVKQGINNLYKIAVRDKNSKDIVEKMLNKKAEIVLDPTLIYDFKNDENIVKPNQNKYIIVYGSFFTDKLIEEARKYADEHGLKIICLNSLNDIYDWCDETIDQDELNPFEWAGYFKYAEIIMTCTYHGLLFGLIFNKKIVFNPTQFILDKAMSLINELNLKEVLIDTTSFFNKVEYSWDYNIINMKLSELKTKSILYLRESLDL